MYRLRLLLVAFVFLFLLSFPHQAYASTMDVFLNPSSGNITADGTEIDILVDTQGEEFIGMMVRIAYTGPIEYMGFVNGNISGCSVSEGTVTEDEFTLFCLIFGDGYVTNQGNFATLKFQAKDNATATIEITEIDVAPLLAQATGGVYNAVLTATDETTTTTTTQTTTNDDLPDTSIFSFSLLVIGLSLVLTAFFVVKSTSNTTQQKENHNMRNKVFD